MKESIYERNARIGADVKRAQFEAKMKMPYKFKKKYASKTFDGIAEAMAEQWG